MIPTQFDYAAPDSLKEALQLLTNNKGAVILAGGHRLLTEMKLRRMSPPMLVDLRKIQELHGIDYNSDGSLRIGAMTTYAEIAAFKDIRESYQALAEAAGDIGDVQIRNTGTIGGNLAFGNPGADLPAAMLALEATINTVGPNGDRTIPIDGFFIGSFETELAAGEIMTSINLPAPKAGAVSAYEKLKNPANGDAIYGIAARFVLAAGESAVTAATVHAASLAKVIVKIPNEEARQEFLSKPVITIGRGSSNTIQIVSPTVSGKHAQIDLTRDGYTITDLNSTNGTYVNNEHLEPGQPHLLTSNDVIRFSKEAEDAATMTYIGPSGFMAEMDEEPVEEETVISDCRIAVTGATSHAMRLRDVESAITGKQASAENIATAVKQAGEGLLSDCLSDLYASAEYRAYLTEALAERVLLRAAGIG